MTSIYLSSDNPRWNPTTEQDIQDGIDQGFVGETHYLDLKRELTPGASKNKDHAKNMAQFALDGGTLIYGVAEDKPTRTFSLAPQPLVGLRERAGNIARSIPDPPLPVNTRTIPSSADQTLGYLIVHVPQSSSAPHMVDGAYYGRGDCQRTVLSDPEVRRLHAARRATEFDAREALHDEFARDPLPEHDAAHLFLLAQPLAPKPEMLLHVLTDRQWHEKLRQLVNRGGFSDEVRRALGPDQCYPDIDNARDGARRSNGAALTSAGLRPDRTLLAEARPEGIVEIEFSDDGAIRIFMARLSEIEMEPYLRDSTGRKLVFETTAVMYVRRLIGIVEAVAVEAGYQGEWALALGATGLSGGQSYNATKSWPHRMGTLFAYDEDTYSRATLASYADLVERPGTVARKLVAPLLRALGSGELYDLALSDPEPA